MEDKKIVGYGSGKIDKSVSFEKHAKHGWVSEISVGKKYQNKGIGNKIMGKIVEFFEGKGIKAIYFFVETDNKQSVKAWEKSNFKKEIIVFHKMLK